MAPSDNYYRFARREMLKFVPERARRILDVGCGNSGFGSVLKAERSRLEVWGVEPVEPAAEAARAVLDRVLNGPFDQALGLPEAYFDAVVFNDSLEHFADHRAPLILARDLLTDEGVLVLSVPNVRYWPHLQHYLLEGDWRYQDAGILDRTHLRFFTRKSIIRELNCFGFSIERLEGINSCWVGLKLRAIEWVLGRRADDLRFQQFAIVARHTNPGG